MVLFAIYPSISVSYTQYTHNVRTWQVARKWLSSIPERNYIALMRLVYQNLIPPETTLNLSSLFLILF